MTDHERTPDRLLPAREFRSRAGIGTTKFYELLNAGTIRAVKLGSRTLVPESEVARLIASLPSAGHRAA